jgi:hypothetical protein
MSARTVTITAPSRMAFRLVDPRRDRDHIVRHTDKGGGSMCRNIRTLANFEPAATEEEIRASALQFVRKLSGTTKPSRVNEAAFNLAVDEVTAAAERLIRSLSTSAPPRNREIERQKARERSMRRFA